MILVGERRVVDARHDRRLHVLQALRGRGAASRAAPRSSWIAGLNSRRRRPVPMNVPLVPRPATKCVTRPPVCSMISGAGRVVVRAPVRRRCCTGPGRSSGPGPAAYERRASRMAPSDPFERVGEHELGAVGAQDPLALGRDVLRHAELHPVAARGADHRVGDAGVARRRVEDRLARRQQRRRARPSRIMRSGGAVLDRPARVLPLGLGVQLDARQTSRSKRRSRRSGVLPTRSVTASVTPSSSGVLVVCAIGNRTGEVPILQRADSYEMGREFATIRSRGGTIGNRAEWSTCGANDLLGATGSELIPASRIQTECPSVA